MLQETLICRNTNYHSTISSRFLRVVSRRFFCVYKDCKTFTNTLPLPLRDDSAFLNGVNILYTSTRELFLVLSVAINYNTKKGAIVMPRISYAFVTPYTFVRRLGANTTFLYTMSRDITSEC